jgi:hypothetical protein
MEETTESGMFSMPHVIVDGRSASVVDRLDNFMCVQFEKCSFVHHRGRVIGQNQKRRVTPTSTFERFVNTL